MITGKDVEVAFSLDGGETWHGISHLLGDTKQEQQTMKKHTHDKVIREWLDNYDTHVVIRGSDMHERCIQVDKPSFHNETKYKVIPRKHLDVALAFYNDGVEVQCGMAERNIWKDCTPDWSMTLDYRIKPKAQPKDGEWWMCKCIGGANLVVQWCELVSLAHKPLYKMVRADD